MERRVPSSTREIAGARLMVSTRGGYSVLVDGDYIGYMHAAQGSLFNAYQRVPGSEPDLWLCKVRLEDAVSAIMLAAGRVPQAA